jgi:SCF-associated factor 1
MSCLYDLPTEIFLENILPYLNAPALTRFGATSKSFHSLIQDDLIWRRKLEEDFRINPLHTGWTSRWASLYQRFMNPEVMAWRRPGHSLYRHISAIGDAFSPVQVTVPGARIMKISAGGSCFHALDSAGNVHVWGFLNGSRIKKLDSSDFSSPATEATRPLRLLLPAPTVSTSCGRFHAATLDSNGHIWTFTSWGRPFRLLSPLLDCTSPESTPQLVQCGTGYTSVLTQSGDVLVWYPLDGDLQSKTNEHNLELDSEGYLVSASSGAIYCDTWEVEATPIKLPSLPPLPDLSQPLEAEQIAPEAHLVQLSGTWNSLIGITNYGHILKIDVSCHREIQDWVYLPNFSDLGYVNRLLGHDESSMEMIRVDTQFNHFSISYGDGSHSAHLLGYEHDNAENIPLVIPDLGSGENVSHVLGDYLTGAFEALTDKGELYSWEQAEDDDDDDPLLSLVSPTSSSSTRVTKTTFGQKRMFYFSPRSDLSYTVALAVCLD